MKPRGNLANKDKKARLKSVHIHSLIQSFIQQIFSEYLSMQLPKVNEYSFTFEIQILFY